MAAETMPMAADDAETTLMAEFVMRTPLYCVALTPKKVRNIAQEEQQLRMLLNGPGTTEMSQVLWVARAMAGIADHREPKFLTHRQRLAVFSDRKQARRWAEKAENEFWKATVREVRVVDADAQERPGNP